MSNFKYTLYAFNHPENSRAHKCLAAARIAGLDCEFKPASIPTPEGWKITHSPGGGSPVLITPNGNVFETNSCLRYIARMDTKKGLYGKDAFEASMIDSWLDFSLSELDIYGTHVVNHALFGASFPSDWLASFEETLAGLELRLAADGGKTFLVGDKLTIADLCIAFVLQIPYRLSGFGEQLVEKFPNTWRMYSAAMAVPEVQEVLKEMGGASGLIPKAPAAASE